MEHVIANLPVAQFPKRIFHIRDVIPSLPLARQQGNVVPSTRGSALYALEQLLMCYERSPYPIASSAVLADEGKHDIFAVACLSPSEELLNYTYNHPDYAHVPRCVMGDKCLGALVPCAGSGTPYGQALPSFRTANTFGLKNLPPTFCIMCLTERQANAGLDQHAQTQVYCLRISRKRIPENRLVCGPGGQYRALDLTACTVVQCTAGGHILYVVEQTQSDTFSTACRTPGSRSSITRSNGRHAWDPTLSYTTRSSETPTTILPAPLS
jgi:hypothetical protein